MKFRYVMEAPEESGGGGDTATDEPHRSVFERPELWDTPPSDDEPAVGATDETGEPADEPEPTPPVAAQPEGWSDEDWGAFQKQFPNGTPADLWKHYSNLRTQFSRGEHKQPQVEPEPEPEAPPPGFTHPDYSILGPIPTDGLSVPEANALAALMAEDPKSAAYWALSNSHKLTEQEFDVIQNTWAQADPQAYRRFWAQQEEARRQAEMEEQFGPRMAVVDIEQQKEGAAMAQEAVPEITAHLPAFKAWLEARPELDEHLATMTNPEQVKNALISSFYQFYGPYRMEMDVQQQREADERERLAAEEAAAAEQAAQQATTRARTATRSAPAAPSGGDATPDDIRAAIRSAHANR